MKYCLLIDVNSWFEIQKFLEHSYFTDCLSLPFLFSVESDLSHYNLSEYHDIKSEATLQWYSFFFFLILGDERYEMHQFRRYYL